MFLTSGIHAKICHGDIFGDHILQVKPKLLLQLPSFLPSSFFSLFSYLPSFLHYLKPKIQAECIAVKLNKAQYSSRKLQIHRRDRKRKHQQPCSVKNAIMQLFPKLWGSQKKKMSFGNFWNPWLKLRKEVFEESQLKSMGFLLS